MPADATPPPPPVIVWQDRVKHAGVQRAGTATVSHTLYLNDCMPDGCLVRPGFDSARQNTSSIPQGPVVLAAYPHGQAHWDSLVACVRETFAPFDIDVVLDDPGTVDPHFEVMIGGSSGDLFPMLQAGGVAPFLGCGASEDDVISFVFPATSRDLNYLCAAVAQEAAHVWGLDHELDAKDPLTYLDLGSSKRFQNSNPRCGTKLESPRDCWCGGETQNTFEYMREAFGLTANLPLPSVAFAAPLDGARVQPGFRIDPQFAGPASVQSLVITLDGVPVPALSERLQIWVAPATLAAGTHTLTVTAVDAADRTTSSTIHVEAPGAIGATCATRADCATPYCAHDDDESICTAACASETECPAGFTCRSTSTTSVCWPTEPVPVDPDPVLESGGGGGCATTRSSLAGMLGAVLLIARRRRRAQPA